MYQLKHILQKKIRELASWHERIVNSVETLRHFPQWNKSMESVEYDDSSWEEISATSQWGGRFTEDAFRFALPKLDPPDKEWERFFVVRPGSRSSFLHPETLMFVDGVSKAAFDRTHHAVALEGLFDPNHPHLIALKVFAGQLPDAKDFAFIGIAERHHLLNQLYWDTKVLLESALTLPPNSAEHHEILHKLNDALLLIDRRQIHSLDFFASIEKSAAAVRALFDSVDEKAPFRPYITAVGHAHLDTAWQWRLYHTRGKLERNVTHMLYLLERYPEYVYFQSQAVQYQMIKEDRPDLFERVKEKIQEGRWNANGALWVEPDTNVPSGESLVRQFLYGIRFYEEELGVKDHLVWLVDTFGYTASLPQIMCGFNVPFMITTKLSWNKINQFPFDTFCWIGLDGSEVLVDQITAPLPFDPYPETVPPWMQSYNGILTPKNVSKTWDNYRHKHLLRERLFAAGHGDGGGGATEDMIEVARRIKRIPGMPQLEWGRVEEYTKTLLAQKEQFPSYDGELYLETHRGTYTSQARAKKNNRECEILLHNAEFLGAWSTTRDGAYNKSEIERAWKLLLLNQFHDVLPGSSIGEVYEDSERDYTEIREITRRSSDNSLRTIVPAKEKQQIVSTDSTHNDDFVIFNTSPFNRSGTYEIELPDTSGEKTFTSANNEPLLTQKPELNKDSNGNLLVNLPVIPSYGYTIIKAAEETFSSSDTEISITARVIENRFLRIEINDNGEIVSLYDKETKREIVPSRACMNSLLLFEDRPLKASAWDIDSDYQAKSWAIHHTDSIKVIERGPLRAGWQLIRTFLSSSLTQRIYMRHDSRRIDFVTEVNWQEREMMLKAAFPVDLRATRAECEIQFGHTTRPTTRNNSIEQARYEICAHRWVDISEDDYGVSLLNDCKYGYDIQNGGLRITLLRAPIKPDPEADRGNHEFTYSLYPHKGRLSDAGVVREGFDLNYPLIADPIESNKTIEATQCLFRVEPDTVVLDTIKPAENGEGIILRFYESAHRRSRTLVQTGFKIAQAKECDMREHPRHDITVNNNSFEIHMKPFEVKTIRLIQSSR